MYHTIALAFPSLDGAHTMRKALGELCRSDLAGIVDGAVVDRLEDGSIRIRQARELVGYGVLYGSTWGALMGLTFLEPWLGAATQSMIVVYAQKFKSVGIDSAFIHDLRETTWPGQSILFLVLNSWDGKCALKILAESDAAIVRTTMPPEEDARFREYFLGAARSAAD
jgi:uncharacterized membrane protein